MTAGATSGDRFRSWPEIQANATRAAGGLRALVVEDDSVALMLRNDFATFEVNMAAGQLGAYAVPINWHFTPRGRRRQRCAFGDRFQEPLSVAERDKALRVLSETELLKPVSDLLHRGSASDYWASLARIGKFILNGYSVRVEVGTCSQFGKMLACQAR
jgi:acyl-CoA synthetase (AMP-forming)/AMP-acid ligase II